MSRLYLLRHAKAEPAPPGGSDRDRPLSQRGRSDAAAVGAALVERGDRAELVLCSPSLRTRQTLDLLLPSIGPAPEVRFLPALYPGSDYLESLRMEGGDAESLLVIGHNPAVRQAALDLAGSPGATEVHIGPGYPTSALAIFDICGSWHELRPAIARLVCFRVPRD